MCRIAGTVQNHVVAILPVQAPDRGIEIDGILLDFIKGLNRAGPLVNAVDCGADDIVYSSLFTGVKGNYLKPSITSAGLDPDNLPEGDISSMDFGAGLMADGKKAWRDIWGCGQGIGAVKDILPASELVDRLAGEYEAARRRLLAA